MVKRVEPLIRQLREMLPPPGRTSRNGRPASRPVYLYAR